MYDTYDKKYLICPYCGHKEMVDFETFDSRDLECSEEHECLGCGKTYIAHRIVFINYETEEIENK